MSAAHAEVIAVLEAPQTLKPVQLKMAFVGEEILPIRVTVGLEQVKV